MLKRILWLSILIITLSFTSCGSGNKEAKELLNQILTLIGIPQNIVVNICEDTNNNGSCDIFEIQKKISINKNDTVDTILQKIQFDSEGRFILENHDLTKNILMEIQDNQDLKYNDGKLTFRYNPTTHELSILQAVIDAGFIEEKETKTIKQLKDRDIVDEVLFNGLVHNQNLLMDRELTSDIALNSNLAKIGDSLQTLDIAEEIPNKIKECNENQVCIDNIKKDILEEVSLTKEEADRIALNLRGENNNSNNSDNNTTNGNSQGSSNANNTGSAVSGSNENTTIASSNDSSTQGTNYTPQKSTKQISDAYLIKLLQPATAICNNNVEYSSTLIVGAKGKITFDKELTDDCIIHVKGNNIVDSNNNGLFDTGIDKPIGFDLKAPATATFVTPLTTLLMAKKENGENISAFKTLVENFDPVTEANNLEKRRAGEKVKVQKLMILMEILKTALKDTDIDTIKDINLSTITKTANSDKLKDFDTSELTKNMPINIKDKIEAKTKSIKMVMPLTDTINPNIIKIDTFIVNISDGGKNILESFKNSIQPSISNSLKQKIEDATSISQIVPLTIKNQYNKDASDYISQTFETINNNIKLIGNGNYNITIVNLDMATLFPPIANAGEDQNISEGRKITISGARSYDIDGNIVSYQWKEGNKTISDKETFIQNYLPLGNHKLTLTVKDDNNATDSDDVNIYIHKRSPNELSANAGEDQDTVVGGLVKLDASKSYDNDGYIVSYEWKEKDTVLSRDINFSTTNFPIGIHNIILTVTDNKLNTATDEVIITITGLSGNTPPIANAGADQNVTEGTTVTLDGSGSSDNDGFIQYYEWKEGTNVLSRDINFTTDAFPIGTHIITLTVVDNKYYTDTDDVIITIRGKIENTPPIAKAGADQNVTLGDSVTLSGSQSSDSDGNIISYQWSENGVEISRDENFTTTAFSVIYL